MNTMTLKQFRATRKHVTNFSPAYAPDITVDGWTYLDVLFIEATSDGRYALQVGSGDWVSDSRAELERGLYHWAVSEHYIRGVR